MAYIGTTPTSGDFILLDSITTSATASYTMQRNSVNIEPQDANHMIVSLNGTIQAPVSSFTVSGSTLTFASALTSSDVIDFILVLGNVNDVGTATTVVDSAITKNKLNLISDSSSAGLTVKGDGSSENGTIQMNCSQNTHGVKISGPAHSAGQSYELILPTGNVTADTFLKVASVSGSGTTGIGQLSFGTVTSGDNTPSFKATSSSGTTVGHDTNAQIAFQTEAWDTDSAYDNSTHYRFTVPSGEAGKYFFGASIELNMTSAVGSVRCQIWKNGSTAIRSNQGGLSYYHNTAICGVLNMAVGDYVEVRVYQNSGGILTTQTGAEDSFFFGYKLAGV